MPYIASYILSESWMMSCLLAFSQNLHNGQVDNHYDYYFINYSGYLVSFLSKPHEAPMPPPTS